MSITLETGTAMWQRLPPRMRKCVDEYEGIIWRLQGNVIIKFIINLAKELLVLVFDNDEPVIEGIVREIKESHIGGYMFYMLIELLATSGPPGDVRLDRTLTVIECFPISVKYDELLQDLIVHSNTPCTWVPMFAQRVDSHRSANIGVLVLHICMFDIYCNLYMEHRIVRAVWLRQHLSTTASRVLGHVRVPGLPSLVMAYAVGPRADDAWRILTAIAEAKVPEHEAKREMTWMGRENDLNVVITQMQEWLPSQHLNFIPTWVYAIEFIISGKIRAYFDDAMHSQHGCGCNFRTGVVMFKSAARDIFRRKTLLSTKDIWGGFTLSVIETLSSNI